MPNWCDNRIEISGEGLADLLAFVASEDNAFDFEKIIPMPGILKHTAGGFRKFEVDGKEIKLNAWWTPNSGDFQIDHQEARPFTADEEAELAAIGHTCWYSWCIANWGTKWNSKWAELDAGEDYAQVRFSTAWSPPVEVIEALRERFPAMHITAFYDEPGMCSAGYY